MALIVQKFGGTSVEDAEHIFNVAGIITQAYDKGNDVVVVVSAQGDTTDLLINKAIEINENASKREMDVLLASGEQISTALLSMAIERMGYPVISLQGWQAGFNTNSNHGSARISKINPERIREALDKKNIVVIAGFQGIDKYSDITTFGRGGSDTSAVAIAAAMNADLCQIYTDVDGVYTADPKIVPNAKKIKEISYDEMLEFATLGAQVLNNRSVELARKYNIQLEVLSSITKVPGTIVKEAVKMEKMLISGVAKDLDVARISIINIPDEPGWAFRLFSNLAANNINVDVILQSIGREPTKDITFTINKGCLNDAIQILDEFTKNINDVEVLYDENVAKVSIIGAGMETHIGIAANMFEALYEKQINIQMISTSEIKVSVLINRSDVDKAVLAIHDKFFATDF